MPEDFAKFTKVELILFETPINKIYFETWWVTGTCAMAMKSATSFYKYLKTFLSLLFFPNFPITQRWLILMVVLPVSVMTLSSERSLRASSNMSLVIMTSEASLRSFHVFR